MNEKDPKEVLATCLEALTGLPSDEVLIIIGSIIACFAKQCLTAGVTKHDAIHMFQVLVNEAVDHAMGEPK